MFWVVDSMSSWILLAHAETSGFGLNLDLFETNLINLAIIIGLLVYAGRGFLGNLLSNRRAAIEAEIREVEEKLASSAQALSQAQTQLKEAEAEAARLLVEAKARAAAVRQEILDKAAADVERLKATAAQDVSTEQQRVLDELRRYAVAQALSRVETQLSQQLDEAAQQRLIDRSLATL